MASSLSESASLEGRARLKSVILISPRSPMRTFSGFQIEMQDALSVDVREADRDGA